MQCEKYLNLIDDLVEGELDEQTSQQVNLHVFACRACGSHYEKLKQEKEIYAYYLFNAEPSSDLWAKLQTKLETETAKTRRSNRILAGIKGWKANFFGFLHFSPALACAALILTLGIGFVLFNYWANENASKNDYLAESQPSAKEIEKVETVISPAGVEKDKNIVPPKKTALNRSSNDKSKPQTDIKTAAVKETKIKKKDFPETRKVNPAQLAQVSEEQRRIRQIRNLENEAAKQVEKIELLLRSFRNARSAESGEEAYDVAYEKQQARRLLEKNVQLRRNAETYGSLYTEEILSRVEPYLLDIANLDSNPSGDKVRDIKERVKNQNIIASLQIY